jgi:hypothetical protein
MAFKFENLNEVVFILKNNLGLERVNRWGLSVTKATGQSSQASVPLNLNLQYALNWVPTGWKLSSGQNCKKRMRPKLTGRISQSMP